MNLGTFCHFLAFSTFLFFGSSTFLFPLYFPFLGHCLVDEHFVVVSLSFSKENFIVIMYFKLEIIVLMFQCRIAYHCLDTEPIHVGLKTEILFLVHFNQQENIQKIHILKWIVLEFVIKNKLSFLLAQKKKKFKLLVHV